MKTQNFLVLLGLLASLVFLSGCGNQSDLSTPIVPTDTLPTDPPADTPTVPPTEVEQSQPESLVLLTPPQGWGEHHSIVEQVASEKGLNLDVRQEMALESAPENLSMVVMMGPPLNVNELTSGLPDIPFLGIGEGEWPGTSNMYVFGTSTGNSPIQAFMAGYIAAVQSDEYRIGIIAVNDSAGQIYREAFLNGVIYFCGTCTPIFPPYEVYPLYVEVPSGADQTTLENATQTLIASGVNTIHIAPALQSDGIYSHLMMIGGIRLVGTQPPPAGLEGIWVASVIENSGISLENAISSILDDQPVADANSSIEISYAGVSEARLSHFYEILEKLESGEIDPVGP